MRLLCNLSAEHRMRLHPLPLLTLPLLLLFEAGADAMALKVVPVHIGYVPKAENTVAYACHSSTSILLIYICFPYLYGLFGYFPQKGDAGYTLGTLRIPNFLFLFEAISPFCVAA